MLCNRTSRFQTSLPRKMESAVGRWEISNKSKRILQEDWIRRKISQIDCIQGIYPTCSWILGKKKDPSSRLCLHCDSESIPQQRG